MILGSLEDFRDAHPTTAEWVIEVAISSLSLDLSKRRIYAGAKIPHYWIVDSENGKIFVFQDPNEDGYNKEMIYTKLEEISIPMVGGKTILLDRI